MQLPSLSFLLAVGLSNMALWEHGPGSAFFLELLGTEPLSSPGTGSPSSEVHLEEAGGFIISFNIHTAHLPTLWLDVSRVIMWGPSSPFTLKNANREPKCERTFVALQGGRGCGVRSGLALAYYKQPCRVCSEQCSAFLCVKKEFCRILGSWDHPASKRAAAALKQA